jgi:serine/threonine-protein kinase
MAEVYLARDRVLGRDVALKVLRDHHAGDEGFVERFRQEARSAASLSHPNVVRVFDGGCCTDDGRYYMVMEYVPGGTLKERISREGSLPAGEAVELARQIARALRVAHDAGFVHRDVKPQNVLLTDTGTAKVGDFGIARAAAAAQTTSVVLGTAAYMSPEQAMGEPLGPGSDLYSLGVVLYEMLTGSLPYDAETPIGIAVKHVNDPPCAPREANPSVPEDLDAVVLRLLSKDPRDRYGSAGELILALHNLRPARPVSPPQQHPGATPEPRRRRRTTGGTAVRVAAALLPAVTLLGGGAWALSAIDARDGSVLGAFSGAVPAQEQARQEPPEAATAPDPVPELAQEEPAEEPASPDRKAEKEPEDAPPEDEPLEGEQLEGFASNEASAPVSVPVTLASRATAPPASEGGQYDEPSQGSAQYAAESQYNLQYAGEGEVVRLTRYAVEDQSGAEDSPYAEEDQLDAEDDRYVVEVQYSVPEAPAGQGAEEADVAPTDGGDEEAEADGAEAEKVDVTGADTPTPQADEQAQEGEADRSDRQTSSSGRMRKGAAQLASEKSVQVSPTQAPKPALPAPRKPEATGAAVEKAPTSTPKADATVAERVVDRTLRSTTLPKETAPSVQNAGPGPGPGARSQSAAPEVQRPVAAKPKVVKPEVAKPGTAQPAARTPVPKVSVAGQAPARKSAEKLRD